VCGLVVFGMYKCTLLEPSTSLYCVCYRPIAFISIALVILVCSVDSNFVICFCREASVALNVWQPEVVRGRQKQMVEQCVVPAESRIRALEMELRLCKQQILGLEKSHVSVNDIYYRF
jgi:hypothetical protein